jgi:hypothetical protein
VYFAKQNREDKRASFVALGEIAFSWRILMENNQLGKTLLIVIIVFYFVFELLLFVLNPSIQIIIRSIIAGVILYFLYHGKKWALILMIALYSLGLLFVIYATITQEMFSHISSLNAYQILNLIFLGLYAMYSLSSLIILSLNRSVRQFLKDVS